MKSDHFLENRPVHLARRDACFERASDMLNCSVDEEANNDRQQHLRTILSLLTAAERHATFACKPEQAGERDRSFMNFLRLFASNVRALLDMTRQQGHLEEEESLLCQFLETSVEECALPAMHYRRRADDLLQGILHMLRLANGPYRRLQQENRAQMSAEDAARYQKAFKSFQTELVEPSA